MTKENLQFSIVIPLFNEAESLKQLTGEIEETLRAQKWSYEVLFINDGSTDESAEILLELSQKECVRVFNFRRNFGKSAALACGFEKARGEYIVTLDADLQDDPKEIPNLLAALKVESADMVSGWKKIRKDPFTKTFPSQIFNGLLRTLTGVKLHDFNCGFKLYKASVVKEISLYGELHRFIPALAAWKGFKVIEKDVHHRVRRFGHSKFGAGRFFAGLIDLFTVIFLMRYERKPSHFFSGFGILFLLIGTFVSVQLFVIKMMGGNIAPRYPYMAFGIFAFVIGIQFIFFGLLSEMIVHLSLRRRAVYRLSDEDS